MRKTLVLLAIVFAGAACAAPGASAPPVDRDPSAFLSDGQTTQPDAVPPEASPTMTEIQLPASILDPIIDEVARDAAISRDAVVVRLAEAVTFPNAGLGCPEPGMAYKQVPVDGYRVVLEAGGTTYDYRGTGTRPPRRCLPVYR